MAKAFDSVRQIALALLAVAVAGCATPQSPTFSDRLVGTWEAVSLVNQTGDTKREPLGAVKGRMSLDMHGNFSIFLMRPDLPKIAAGNRESPTPEESRAISTGLLFYFGKYTVNDDERVLTINIEGSSFPNWNGVTQKRLLLLSENQLTLRNQTTAVGGGSSDLVWRRLP